jgi:hypothetical protein
VVFWVPGAFVLGIILGLVMYVGKSMPENRFIRLMIEQIHP